MWSNLRGFNTCLPILVILFSFSNTGNAFSSVRFATTVTRAYTSDDFLQQRQQPMEYGSPLLSALNMQKPGRKEENKNSLELSAYASELLDYDSQMSTIIPEPSVLDTFVLPVATASLMVTGTTVGAGMLVLPEVAAGPGPMLSFGVMIGAWLMCLISGLTIAQVAIQEHESSGTEVPSSFKEFAEATLPSAANMVSGTSVFINTLIVAFDVFKAGQIGSTLLPPALGVDGMLITYIYSGLLVGLVSTQSLKTLSQVASLMVMGLFATFAGLLLPGLSNVSDPASVLSMAPALPTEEIGDGILLMTPVVVSVLVFQNIVPTITRFLEYDRAKIGTALFCGSFIPLLMYMAWTLTVLGGGIDVSSASGPALGGLMTCFSLITVAGSSLGGSMSLSEEFEIFLGDSFDEEEKQQGVYESTFSLQSVAIPVGMALVLAQVFAADITETLKIAGAFGSPILYGFIPVSMALMQQREAEKMGNYGNAGDEGSSIIPGGIAGLGVLAFGSIALLGTELFQTFSN